MPMRRLVYREMLRVATMSISRTVVLLPMSLRTTRIDSPRMYTTFWSAIIRGAVRKKYAAVKWNSETARMIVKGEISAMVRKTALQPNART